MSLLYHCLVSSIKLLLICVDKNICLPCILKKTPDFNQMETDTHTHTHTHTHRATCSGINRTERETPLALTHHTHHTHTHTQTHTHTRETRHALHTPLTH